MNRSTLCKFISTMATIVAVVLILVSAGLFYAYNFVHGQVTSQLSAEKIIFPAKASSAYTSLPESDQTAMSGYVGQELTTGAQAKVFADNYIAVHLDKIGGGKTYSELSEASMADPSNTALAGTVDTVFRGQTLRGLLLNAYAFDTMATVALVSAFGTLIAGTLLVILAYFGFSHAKRIKTN